MGNTNPESYARITKDEMRKILTDDVVSVVNKCCTYKTFLNMSTSYEEYKKNYTKKKIGWFKRLFGCKQEEILTLKQYIEKQYKIYRSSDFGFGTIFYKNRVKFYDIEIFVLKMKNLCEITNDYVLLSQHDVNDLLLLKRIYSLYNKEEYEKYKEFYLIWTKEV